LKHILGDKAVFHYWEAVPTEPEKGLLRATLEKWPEDSAKPATLDELPHERLIPALYRLTGRLLAEVDQVKLKFENAFLAWQKNDKRSHYLLKAKELRLVERFETQIPWGKDEQEKKNYLQRSKRRRRFVRVAAVAAGLALIGSSWVAELQLQRFENRRFLREILFQRPSPSSELLPSIFTTDREFRFALAGKQWLRVPNWDREVRTSETAKHGYVYGDHFAFGVE